MNKWFSNFELKKERLSSLQAVEHALFLANLIFCILSNCIIYNIISSLLDKKLRMIIINQIRIKNSTSHNYITFNFNSSNSNDNCIFEHLQRCNLMTRFVANNKDGYISYYIVYNWCIRKTLSFLLICYLFIQICVYLICIIQMQYELDKYPNNKCNEYKYLLQNNFMQNIQMDCNDKLCINSKHSGQSVGNNNEIV